MDVTQQKFLGVEKAGVLLNFSSMSEEDRIIPVGVVAFEDGSMECVPVEFIQKI